MIEEQFKKMVKLGRGSIPVFELEIQAGTATLRGSGVLSIRPGEFDLHVSCSEGAPPEIPNVVMRENFWTVMGKLVSGLQFVCRNVPPSFGRQGLETPWSCHLQPDSIEIEAEGFDALTYDELEADFARLDDHLRKQGKEFIPINRNYTRRSGICHLTSANYRLLYGDASITETINHPFFGESGGDVGNVLQGKSGKYEYCLSQAEEDLDIDIRSKGDEVTSFEEDRSFLNALLTTIAFIHGAEPKNYHFQHWRDHKLIINEFSPIRAVPRTRNIPFPEVFVYASITGQAEFSFRKAFETVLQFFVRQSKLQHDLATYLNELRFAAADGLNASHARLAVCRIFEGVVDILFRHLNLESSDGLGDTAAFESAKEHATKWLATQQGPEFKRLQVILDSAGYLTIREKFFAVLRRLCFREDGIMSQVFADWKKLRNPLAHGKTSTGQLDSGIYTEWLSHVRVIGGINLLVLKTMGYTGLMRLSHLENLNVLVTPSEPPVS